MTKAVSEHTQVKASQRSDLSGVFQKKEIHDEWESVYRRGRLQQAFDGAIAKRLLRYLAIPSDGCILDAGCGTGNHTVRLAAAGFRCVGVDLSGAVLQRAERLAAARGVASKVSFFRCRLEDMSRFGDGAFDAIHCRGVLMHIPRWQDAVRELGRVLKPGGRIAILENNYRSLELLLVRLVRVLRNSDSEMVRTEAGMEFRCRTSGAVPLTRVTNLTRLVSELRSHRVREVARFATQFWDIARFPRGVCRAAAILFNRCWFSLRLPSFPSSGNAVIGEKH
jgi:ubiquinone/menaquinone biosynthesis C-methylase UbiE